MLIIRKVLLDYFIMKDYTATQKKSGTFDEIHVFLCILSR